MSTAAPPIHITREEVERASERDAKHYELVYGQLKEKVVGTKSLFIASQICERLNAMFYPKAGFAVVEAMVYCFGRPNHGRKPDVSFVRFDRLEGKTVPVGDILVAPD